MKKLLTIFIFSIFAISAFTQNVSYPGTRTFTGIIEVSPAAVFKIGTFFINKNADSLWLEKPQGVWLSSISEMGDYVENSIANILADTADLFATKYDLDTLEFVIQTKLNDKLAKADTVSLLATKYDLIEKSETISRTIYVAPSPTGDDITGTGLIGAPFATPLRALKNIKTIINNGIIITISQASGSYSVDGNQIEAEYANKIMLGTGQIIFQGGFTTLTSGFTIAAQSPNAYMYNISGATWTINQYQDKLLKNSNNYYGVIENGTTTLNTVTGAAGSTSVVEFNVIWNITNNLTFHAKYATSPNDNQAIIMELMQLNFGSSAGVLSFKSLLCNIRRCQIIAGSLTIYCPSNEATTVNTSSIVLSTGGLTVSNGIQIRTTTIRKTGTKTGTGITFPQYSGRNQHLTYIDNFTSGIQIGSGLVYNQSGGNLIITNCTNGIALRAGSFIDFSSLAKLYINSITNLFIDVTDAPLFSYGGRISDLIGAPTNYLSTNLLINGYVNPSKNICFSIPGIYPEISTGSLPLANNVATSIAIGDIAQNKSISINYTVKRGSGYRVGRFDIFYDGSMVWITPDEFSTNLDAGVDNTAIVFDTYLNGNVINMRATLNNTGTAATIQYNVTRIMQ